MNARQVLGVSMDADADAIKRAYHSLALKYHPDRGGDPQSFSEIHEAYRSLQSEARKPYPTAQAGTYRPKWEPPVETHATLSSFARSPAYQPRSIDRGPRLRTIHRVRDQRKVHPTPTAKFGEIRDWFDSIYISFGASMLAAIRCSLPNAFSIGGFAGLYLSFMLLFTLPSLLCVMASANDLRSGKNIHRTVTFTLLAAIFLLTFQAPWLSN